MTRQKSSGRQCPACTYYPGEARGCGQGGARAGPQRQGRQKTAHPAVPRLACSGHRDLWGGPRTANQGPRGAHSFKTPAGKGVRLGPELPGTLRHARVPWGLGKSPGGPDRRKLDACRDRRVAAPQFQPSNPGVACPPPGPCCAGLRPRLHQDLPAAQNPLGPSVPGGKGLPGGFPAAGSGSKGPGRWAGGGCRHVDAGQGVPHLSLPSRPATHGSHPRRCCPSSRRPRRISTQRECSARSGTGTGPLRTP